MNIKDNKSILPRLNKDIHITKQENTHTLNGKLQISIKLIKESDLKNLLKFLFIKDHAQKYI